MGFKNIVILTGAGISADSGLATFRDSGGLWEQYELTDIATPEAFHKDPILVWKFYSLRRIQAAKAKPNLAHISLVEFARKNPEKSVTLITQNVDVLHLRADLNEVLPPLTMHGNLHESRCSQCEEVYIDDFSYFNEAGDYAPTQLNLCPVSLRAAPNYLHHYNLKFQSFLPLSPCCGKLLRPNIVWFGEYPMHMQRIQTELKKCDLFISIGTSGNVYPAAGFLQEARARGAKTVCLNKEEIIQSEYCDEFIEGRAIEIVPRYLAKLT